MKIKTIIGCLVSVLMVALVAVGCAAQDGAPHSEEAAHGETHHASAETGDHHTETHAMDHLLCDKSVSFLAEQGDTIEYTVKVYQDKDNKITVTTDSNSEFFDTFWYDTVYDKPLSESDVDVKWTTLMGNPEPKDDDQWAVAEITISDDGKVISQRKINFVSKVMEAIA